MVTLGCGSETTDLTTSNTPPADLDPTDLVVESDGKQDSLGFNPNLLIDDAVFVDYEYMTEEDVQAFLENTPYGRRSYLADYESDGQLTSKLIIEAARKHHINPLVFLVKLQVEMALISKRSTPTTFQLNHAMGCGCPDGLLCHQALAGFGSQINCAGAMFRSYLDDIEENGSTISGWKPHGSKNTSDHLTVTPKNSATAALYTYTPWVLSGTGGNWLFWNIHRKYSRAILKSRPNHRWIGGPCTKNEECAYDGGICLGKTLLRNGTCSLSCDRLCPDSSQAYTASTFCIDLGTALDNEPAGYCVAHCDPSLFPENEGCPQEQKCVESVRFGDDSETQRSVCIREHLL